MQPPTIQTEMVMDDLLLLGACESKGLWVERYTHPSMNDVGQRYGHVIQLSEAGEEYLRSLESTGGSTG